MSIKKRKRTLLLAASFSLIICMCFTAFIGCTDKGEKGDTTSSPEDITATSDLTTPYSGTTSSDDPVTPDVTTTAVPTESATAPVTPDVTTDKAPETTVLPAPIASEGVFNMDTGTTLGYRVEWKLDKFDNEYAYIDVTIVLETYEIYVSQRRNLGVINYGDESIRFSTDRIAYEGKKKTEIILTYVQIQIPAQGDVAVAFLEGQWFYNGSYSGVEYDWLSAGGYVCVKRP